MGALCSTPPEPPPNPLVVDLTHFTLLKVVGKGGFGKVNAIQRRSNDELMALKRMSKAEVLKKESHVRMVWTERDIMARLNSPFLVNLVHAFQDERECYFVMPFMQGGDLRFHLSKLGCFPERDARYYTAQIVLGLEAMHSHKIVYRDLKPDNLLLDSSGMLRVSDYGLSVELQEKNGWKIRGNAGTSGYLAPEVCTGEPYGLSCDVWSLGITIYEMIHGRRPFKQWKPTDTNDPANSMRFGSGVSEACQDLIRGLLALNPQKRLGCLKGGWEDVRNHVWFADMDWDAMRARAIKAPISPDPDAANCNNSADLADQLMDKEPEPVAPEQQKAFVGFEFNVDVKLFLEKQRRDENLAGLNLSTAGTDVGGGSTVANSNASHMIDGEAQGHGAATAEPSPKQGASNTLQLPAGSTAAGSSSFLSPSNSGSHVPPPAMAQQAAAQATLVPALSTANKPATDAEAFEGAHVQGHARDGSSATSAAKYEVAAAEEADEAAQADLHASAAAQADPAPVAAISPRKQSGAVMAPVSARGGGTARSRPGTANAMGAAQPLTEIPFTRHGIAASPRREAGQDA